MQSNLTVKVGADIQGLQKELQKAQSSLGVFSKAASSLQSTLTGVFGGIGLATLANFTMEVSKLAGEAQGVKAAFDRLPNSIKLLNELKNATGGTVSELDLMKRAVQASNFEISLSALPKLLQFATLRAQQTGQSVDYLVDSIVTGIGRKSKLILDNLGISAVALGEKMKGVSMEAASVGDVAEAVGKIAEESLKNMAGFAENASTKMQRLSASWENFKVALGSGNGGFIDKSLNMATNTLNALSGDEITTGLNQLKASMGQNAEILERFAAAGGKIDLSWQELLARGFLKNEAAAKKYEKILAEVAKKQNDLKLASGEVDPITGLPTGGKKPWYVSMAPKEVKTLESLKNQLKELNAEFETTDINDKKKLANLASEIQALDILIKKYNELRKGERAGTLADLKKVVTPFTPDVKPTTDNPYGNTDPFAVADDSMFSNPVPGVVEEIEMNWELADSLANLAEKREKANAAMERQIELGLQLGDVIGSSMVDIVSGEAKAANALKGISSIVVDQFQKQALAAIVAKAAIYGKNPVVAIAAATAGFAAIKGLFNKIGSSGAGGSGAGGGGMEAGNVSPFRESRGSNSNVIILRAQGRDLVGAIDAERIATGRTG